MKSIIIGGETDLGVHIDGAKLGPVQLINDVRSFYKGEILEYKQDENIIKSRNLSDRSKNKYEKFCQTATVFCKLCVYIIEDNK